jgi:uncharacterized tellurite resistance protein B-like protein
MFDALKSLFAEVSGSGAPARSRADEGRRLAAVALLVNVANVDGEIGLAERCRLKKIIEERFGLDANTAAELIALAEESDREAVDFYNFTRVLKRTLDDDGRKEIVEMLWDVALADGRSTNSKQTRFGGSPNFLVFRPATESCCASALPDKNLQTPNLKVLGLPPRRKQKHERGRSNSGSRSGSAKMTEDGHPVPAQQPVPSENRFADEAPD